jgi:protein TonB
VRNRDAPAEQEPGFEYHGEQWIAKLEQSWLASLRNNLADWLLARELPNTTPSGPYVASHRLSGSEPYIHQLLEDIRVPWWRSFNDDLRDFVASVRAGEPRGPDLELSLASQHIRQLVPAMQRSLVHSIAIELRYLLTPQKLTPAERAAAAKHPKYHFPLDVMGVIVAIAWHGVIIGVALAYSATHHHVPQPAEHIKTVQWPTTPIYFVPEPNEVAGGTGPKPNEVAGGTGPTLTIPAKPERYAPVRQPGPAPTVATVPVVAAPKVEDLTSVPALPYGLALSVGVPAAPVAASGTGTGGIGGGGPGGGTGLGGGAGSGRGTGTGMGTGSKPDRIRVRVSPGSVLHDVKPIYPHVALVGRIQGDVVLLAVIAKDGTVKEVSLIRGHPVLVQAAIEAVRQRRYRPTTLNGEPVEVETEVTISFVFDK